MQLIFEQLRAGGDRNFGYLLGDRDTGQGVLIDPSYSPEAFVQRAIDQRLTVTHVINTHGHPDHTTGDSKAVELTAAPVAAFADSVLVRPDLGLNDEQELAVGGLRLQFLHVPGHCADHLVVYEPSWRILITGDLLFVGKVGGTTNDDEPRTEWGSLQRLVAWVPGEVALTAPRRSRRALVRQHHRCSVAPRRCSNAVREQADSPALESGGPFSRS